MVHLRMSLKLSPYIFILILYISKNRYETWDGPPKNMILLGQWQKESIRSSWVEKVYDRMLHHKNFSDKISRIGYSPLSFPGVSTDDYLHEN